MRRFIAGLLLVVIAIALCSCATPEKTIVGTWKSQTTVLGVVTETSYTFKDDGTGIKSGLLDIGFTYSFDGNSLFITTNTLGIETTAKYSVELSGDKMVLTSSTETIDLERVK